MSANAIETNNIQAWFLEAQAALEQNPPAVGLKSDLQNDTPKGTLKRLARAQSARIANQARVLNSKDQIIAMQAELLRQA